MVIYSHLLRCGWKVTYNGQKISFLETLDQIIAARQRISSTLADKKIGRDSIFLSKNINAKERCKSRIHGKSTKDHTKSAGRVPNRLRERVKDTDSCVVVMKNMFYIMVY